MQYIRTPPPAPPPAPRLFLGLDLGQSNDYSALAIAERDRPPGTREPASYALSWLQRFPLKTPYPAIVAGVATLVRQLAAREPTPSLRLVVDKTGVGAAVVDLLRREKLPGTFIDVTITGGDAVARDGNSYRVPKRDLVGTVQVLLQGERLKIASALPEAQTLTAELLNFQVKITDTAHDTYGAWREGTNDDLVLAAALALWYGEHEPPPPPPLVPTVVYQFGQPVPLEYPARKGDRR